MSNIIKGNIKKRLKIDLSKYDRVYVERTILQVEALFVYSILKSVVFS
jgi:hypothetical protein